MSGRAGAAVGRLRSDRAGLALTGVALVTGRVVERVCCSSVAPAAALVGSMGAVAGVGSLTPAQLGLSRSTWHRGWAWGVAAGAAVGSAYLVASAVPRARTAAAAGGTDGRRALAEAAVRIPLLTVLPEELAFRGVLFALLSRIGGAGAAVTCSSLAFGLWHVPTALSGGPANAAATSVIGSSRPAVALRVAATVAFTAGAGFVLAALRQRTDSLLAPLLAHWAANGFGVLFAAVGQRHFPASSRRRLRSAATSRASSRRAGRRGRRGLRSASRAGG